MYNIHNMLTELLFMYLHFTLSYEIIFVSNIINALQIPYKRGKVILVIICYSIYTRGR